METLNLDITRKFQILFYFSTYLAATYRECMKDYDYDDGQCKFTIKKRNFINIPIYGLHFDGKYWDNPKKFDPDENKAKK